MICCILLFSGQHFLKVKYSKYYLLFLNVVNCSSHVMLTFPSETNAQQFGNFRCQCFSTLQISVSKLLIRYAFIKKNSFQCLILINIYEFDVIYSYKIMQTIQNLQNSEKEQATQALRHHQQFFQKREKSTAKFNRKSPNQQGQKKRKNDQSTQAKQHRIVYISPAKNIPISKTTTPTPTLSDVINRFSISNEELFDYKPKELNNHPQTCHSESCRQKLQNKQKEIKFIKQKYEKFKEQNLQLIEQQKDLKEKVKSFEGIQSFLMQRESFISQILESNIKLNETVQKLENEKLAMAQHFGVLLQEKLDCENQYQKQYIEWNKILEEKNSQITRLLSRLQSTVVKVKSSKHQKENIPDENEVNSQNNPKISKKGQFEFSRRDLNTSHVKVSFVGEQWIHERQRLEKMINQLQERIKYGNIEMDILKKQKQDSSKLNITNQTLKKQNRKLLNRLHYLTRNFSRNNSDSQLQLSLSPKHT